MPAGLGDPAVIRDGADPTRLLAVDAQGRLSIGTVVTPGPTNTPTDADANPANVQEVESFLELWDPVALTWRRAAIVTTQAPTAVTGPLAVGLTAFDVTNTVLRRLQSASGDGLFMPTILGMNPVLFDATSTSGGQRQRTPNTFKTATATAAGDTAIWTPAAGKKFRVMRYQIQVTSDAARAAAGDVEIVLRDAATAIGLGFSAFIPGAAGTVVGNTNNSGWIDLGNGYLSTTANNALNVNLSAALTAGEVRVVVCGTEE